MKIKNGSLRIEKIGNFNKFYFLSLQTALFIFITTFFFSCKEKKCPVISDLIVYKSLEFVLISPEYSNYFMNRIYLEKNDLINSGTSFELSSFGTGSMEKRRYKLDYIEKDKIVDKESTRIYFNKFSIYDGNSTVMVEFSAYPSEMNFTLTFTKNEKGDWLCVENKATAIANP